MRCILQSAVCLLWWPCHNFDDTDSVIMAPEGTPHKMAILGPCGQQCMSEISNMANNQICLPDGSSCVIFPREWKEIMTLCDFRGVHGTRLYLLNKRWPTSLWIKFCPQNAILNLEDNIWFPCTLYLPSKCPQVPNDMNRWLRWSNRTLEMQILESHQKDMLSFHFDGRIKVRWRCQLIVTLHASTPSEESFCQFAPLGCRLSFLFAPMFQSSLPMNEPMHPYFQTKHNATCIRLITFFPSPERLAATPV